MNRTTLISIGIIILSFIVGLYFYPLMPATLPSHWNIQGEVDGYLPKFWGLFLMPIISLVLFLLFLIIPKIDPEAGNIKKFRKYFDNFIALILLFLFYIYLLTIFWNLNWRFNMGQLLTPAFGVLFYYAGILIEHAKKNWFIGIRTPWTLSSEKVWDKTHRLGGKLFKICGLLSLSGIFFPTIAFYVIIGSALAFSLFIFAYSYFEYRKN